MLQGIRPALLCVLLAASTLARAQSNNLLWYDKPAADWEKEALPIGNGRIGAMVFGGVSGERLQIAEKSLFCDVDPEQLRDLIDHDHETDACLESDEHRL